MSRAKLGARRKKKPWTRSAPSAAGGRHGFEMPTAPIVREVTSRDDYGRRTGAEDVGQGRPS
jgi:hypothetical protein